jgi:hypothetical protein
VAKEEAKSRRDTIPAKCFIKPLGGGSVEVVEFMLAVAGSVRKENAYAVARRVQIE